jgi:hypothetical protein
MCRNLSTSAKLCYRAEEQPVDVAAVRPRPACLPIVAILDGGDVAGSMPGCVITIPRDCLDALDQAEVSKADLVP